MNLCPPKIQTTCHTWKCIVCGKLSVLAILAESYFKTSTNESTVRHLNMDHSFLSQLAHIRLTAETGLSQEFLCEILKT